ncbi:MAG: hypothetical protein E7622_05575 [Ruminococcaceae bacterium]|nr:hypothetical protein [Oscillospiraceae bacterium]
MLDLIVAFLIAILMGMGIGGGGFLVIYLTLCSNFGQIIAQGTNLVFFIICAISAVFVHIFKRKISFLQVLIMATLGSVGAFVTSSLANTVNPEIPRICLGILLCVSGTLSIIKNTKKK